MTQSHCARFSKQLYPVIQAMIVDMPRLRDGYPNTVYDPMAGVGGLEAILEPFHDLAPWGSEIEAEYAAEKAWIVHEDCRNHVDDYCLVVTSPPYGNRMADQYLGTPIEQELRAATGRKPRRNSYAIDLGRKVSEGSSAGLQWGPKYRDLMTDIWTHVAEKNVSPGGHLIVNVASHFRDKKYQPVAEWTLETILDLGLELTAAHLVETPGLRDGQNSEARVGHEMVYLFRKEA